METFTIGGDLEVRRLGFGAMRITGNGIWGPPDDPEEAKRLLRRVVELGVNLIDTADSYGPEVSENLIAEALHPYPDGLVIATKGGLRRSGPGPVAARCPAGAAEGVLRGEPAAAEARPHRPLPAPLARPAGAARGLGGRAEGAPGRGQDPARGRLERVARRAGAGARDRRGRDRAEPLQPRGPPLGGRARAPAKRPGSASSPGSRSRWAGSPSPAGRSTGSRATHDATPAQIALAWLLARSPVMLPIPGTSSVEHFEENLAAARIELSPDEVAEIGSATEG